MKLTCLLSTSSGRLKAVCNTACTCDKVSNRKLRGAVYVNPAQVTHHGGRLEPPKRGVFQMDTIPAIAGYGCAIPKHCCGAAKNCHVITDAPTDCTAVK